MLPSPAMLSMTYHNPISGVGIFRSAYAITTRNPTPRNNVITPPQATDEDVTRWASLLTLFWFIDRDWRWCAYIAPRPNRTAGTVSSAICTSSRKLRVRM